MFEVAEMAYRRSDAIDRCANLGKQFVEHFTKIMDAGGITDPDFKHHCSEMTAWLDFVRKITLKPSNKLLNTEYLMDWFFTMGSSIDIIVPEKYESIYSSFVAKLLANRDKKVSDALAESIKENQAE